MDRRELAALFVGCEPGAFLGYKDYGDHVVVILPDGRKMAIRSSELDAMSVIAAPAPAKKAVAPAGSEPAASPKKAARPGQPAGRKSAKKPNSPISRKPKSSA